MYDLGLFLAAGVSGLVGGYLLKPYIDYKIQQAKDKIKSKF